MNLVVHLNILKGIDEFEQFEHVNDSPDLLDKGIFRQRGDFGAGCEGNNVGN